MEWPYMLGINSTLLTGRDWRSWSMSRTTGREEHLNKEDRREKFKLRLCMV